MGEHTWIRFESKLYELGHAFESCAPTLFFIFQPENILGSNFNFSTCYGRSTDLKSLSGLFLQVGLSLYSEFYMALRKNFTKIFTYGRGDVYPPMNRRCLHRFCSNWLSLLPKL